MYRYCTSIQEPSCLLHQLTNHDDFDKKGCRDIVENYVCFLLLTGPVSDFCFDTVLQPYFSHENRENIIDIVHNQLIRILRPVIGDTVVCVEFQDSGDVEIVVDDFYDTSSLDIEEDITDDYAVGAGRP